MKDTLVGLGKILQKASEASWVVRAPDYECTYTCDGVACGADEYADNENGEITACSPEGEVELGLARFVDLCHRSSTLHPSHHHTRHLFF
jgi:hypothetical protein